MARGTSFSEARASEIVELRDLIDEHNQECSKLSAAIKEKRHALQEKSKQVSELEAKLAEIADGLSTPFLRLIGVEKTAKRKATTKGKASARMSHEEHVEWAIKILERAGGKMPLNDLNKEYRKLGRNPTLLANQLQQSTAFRITGRPRKRTVKLTG